MTTEKQIPAAVTRRTALGVLAAAPAIVAQLATAQGAPKPSANRPAFREPLMPFRQFTRYGYKDQLGTIVLKPIFDAAGPFFDPLGRPRQIAWVRVGTKYGYIDRQGNYLIQPAFDLIREFSEGMAAFQLNGRYGCVDENGRIVIKPDYEEIEPFSNGLAAARLDGKTGWVDRAGQYHARRPGDGTAR